MHKNIDHPFFRPLWRRAAVIVICLVWAVVEFTTNSPFWGVIALGFAGYGYWVFIQTYPDDPESGPFEPDVRNGN